jgi:hypothetical protein
LDPVKKQRLKALIGEKSLSKEVNELISRRIAELEGANHVDFDAQDYDTMKKQHASMLQELGNLTRRLQKAGCYDKLGKLAVSLGLRGDCGNISELASKLLSAWKGPREYAHLFITLIQQYH